MASSISRPDKGKPSKDTQGKVDKVVTGSSAPKPGDKKPADKKK